MQIPIEIDDTAIAALVRSEVSRLFALPNGRYDSGGGNGYKLVQRIVREWIYTPDVQAAITQRVQDEVTRLLPGAITEALETALVAAIKQSVKAMQKDGTLAQIVSDR